MLVLANTKLVARLLASDFPSENPRPQTRNFPYTNTLATIMKKILLPLIIFGFITLFSFQRKTDSDSYWIAVKSYPSNDESFHYVYNGMIIHFTDDKVEIGNVFSDLRKEYDLKVENQKILLNNTLVCKIFAKYEDSLLLDFEESTRVKFIRLDKKNALEKETDFPKNKHWILSHNDHQRGIILTDSLYFDERVSKICIQKNLQNNIFISTIDKWNFININNNYLFVKTYNQFDDEFYRFKNYIGDSIIELELLANPEVKASLKKIPYVSDLKKREILNKIENYKWNTNKIIQLDTLGQGSYDWDSNIIKLKSLKDKKVSFKFSNNSTYNIYISDISIANGNWKLSQTGNEIILNDGTSPSDYIDLINVSLDSMVIGNLRRFESQEVNYGMDIEMYYKIKLTK
ncbi:hypothetical protein [Confluentibacter citreus]|uniref:hypothetical protein n=1 Tax=Confluentibacter citreus TaxID=2007307 RepID=UPI0012FE5699|nr:hypothetical protein [Confluentibacter citreus]